MPKHQLPPSSEYRILVLGDRAVGKTSFIARYVRNEYPCHMRSKKTLDNSTIYQTVMDGIDYTLIFIDISTTYDLERIRFADTIPTVCFILFSITDQRSFSKLNYFYESIHVRSSHQSKRIPIFIVANKIDLEQDRMITQESIDMLKTNGCDVFDISIKGNVGIGDVIYTAIKHLQYDALETMKPTDACACIIS